MGVCVGVQNGQKWKAMRKAFEPQFSHKSAMGFMKTFAAEIQRWRQELAVKGGETGDFVVDATSCCRILPFKLVALACYGRVMTDEVRQSKWGNPEFC
jgi:cytochrome P450 monooxygenase